MVKKLRYTNALAVLLTVAGLSAPALAGSEDVVVENAEGHEATDGREPLRLAQHGFHVGQRLPSNPSMRSRAPMRLPPN